MKRYFLLILFLFSFAASAQVTKSKEDAKFDFRSIGVAQVVQLIYSEALTDSYVIDPSVLTDERLVSFRYDGSGKLRQFIDNFFDSIGLVVVRRNGVDYVGKSVAKVVIEPEKDIFVYRPRFRDGSYLVELLSPLFKGSFTSRRLVQPAVGDASNHTASAPPGSAAASIDRRSDTLVFSGVPGEVASLKKLLAQVDTSVGDVIVRGVLYEVQTSNADGSAFGLALGILGNKFTLGLGSPVVPGQNFLKFSNASIDAVLSSLATDSRFTVKSTPTLRVSSGGTGRFTVGQDVPVLGAVTFAGSTGAAVRSVEYRSSGVIFDLQPVVHDSGIDITLMQQVSNFVATLTGVNDSPTLIKRELKTNLTLADNELVFIGGLAENKETATHSGLSFIPDFLKTKSSDKSTTEILLVLQVTKI